MKIVLNSQNVDLINSFLQQSKDTDYELVNAKVEKILFDHIVAGNVDAFILENSTSYVQKAVDFIKKRQPYIPVILIGDKVTDINEADVYIPSEDHLLFPAILKNLKVYQNNFKKLQKLTAKISEIIEFGECTYDPTRRKFLHKEKEVTKLSAKAGGILEVLALNYGQVVNKDVILEKVWRKSDYFAGRSMDVYLTHLRKMFRENKIKLTIKNISGVGLILE